MGRGLFVLCAYLIEGHLDAVPYRDRRAVLSRPPSRPGRGTHLGKFKEAAERATLLAELSLHACDCGGDVDHDTIMRFFAQITSAKKRLGVCELASLKRGMLKAFDIDPPCLAQELFPDFMAKRPDPVQQLSSDLKPKGHSTDEIRGWVQGIVDKYKVTSSEWARTSGLAPSTLNRFLTSKGSYANLSARTIDSLDLGIRKILHARNEQELFQKDRYRIGWTDYVTIDVPMIGRIARYTPDAIDDNRYSGRIFSLPVMAEESNHYICAFGVSSNYKDIYYAGSILICRPVFGKRPPIIRGARYIHHQKHEDGSIEARIYDFSSDPQGNYWFLPLKGREKFDQPLFLGRNTKSGSVDIQGKATFIVIGHMSPNSFLRDHYIELERAQAEYERDQETERERQEEEREREREEMEAQEQEDGSDSE